MLSSYYSARSSKQKAVTGASSQSGLVMGMYVDIANPCQQAPTPLCGHV